MAATNAIRTLTDVQMKWEGPKVAAQLERAVGKGVQAAAIFLKSRVQEFLSIPAPRRRVLGKRGRMAGVVYYVATTKATRGAAPRKLSGKFRQSMAYQMVDSTTARVGTNDIRARRFELDINHPFLMKTAEMFRSQLGTIVGQGGLGGGIEGAS